jgi:hypothetical protein
MSIIRTVKRPGSRKTCRAHVIGLVRRGDINALMKQYGEIIEVIIPDQDDDAYPWTTYPIIIIPWSIDQQRVALEAEMNNQKEIADALNLKGEQLRVLNEARQRRNDFLPILKAATQEIGMEVSEESPGMLTLCFKDNRTPPTEALRPVVFEVIDALVGADAPEQVEDDGLEQTETSGKPEANKQIIYYYHSPQNEMTKAEKLEAYQDWRNRDKFSSHIYEEWAFVKFNGPDPAGTPKVPYNTLISWKRYERPIDDS